MGGGALHLQRLEAWVGNKESVGHGGRTHRPGSCQPGGTGRSVSGVCTVGGHSGAFLLQLGRDLIRNQLHGAHHFAMFQAADLRPRYNVIGSCCLYEVAHALGYPLWRAEFAREYTEACSRWRVTPQPSCNCIVECAYDVDITDGPFAGFMRSLCCGAENMEGAAAEAPHEPGAIEIMTDLYDGLGRGDGPAKACDPQSSGR